MDNNITMFINIESEIVDEIDVYNHLFAFFAVSFNVLYP